MPADRFYVHGLLAKGSAVKLEESEHHHLSRVMRIGVGEEVEIVNGEGALAVAKVSSIDKHSTTLHVLHADTTPRSGRQIILAVPLMRPNKLELVIEKGTELGADAFWIYAADYSEKGELSPNQLERLRTLSISALKQSGRLFLPALELLPSLESVHGHLLYGDTRPNALSLAQIQLEHTTIFVTGPERGFSQRETELLEKKGRGVRLNPFTLRAETAPLAAVSILRQFQ
jgi:16S rRNA (uracil1498-N3)-methyltransferase